jgi:sodium/hydrogen exchanger 8
VQCSNSCSGNGACFQFYELNPEENAYTPYHICQCYKGIIGYACEECDRGYFGPDCLACPVDNGKICSGNGVCRDGRDGDGKCLCFGEFNSETNCAEEKTFGDMESMASLRMLYMLGAGIVVILMIYLFIRLPGFNILPECVASIVIGIAIGFILTESDIALADSLTMDPESFFLYMLPPILYDAGYYVEKTRFFKNGSVIFVFAVLGTFVSAMVFAVGLYLVANLFDIYDVSWLESFIFGSLISATDPVATLGIFNSMNVDDNIQMIVFGESAINDAIAIALYRTFTSFIKQETVSASEPIILFSYIFFVSIIIGVGISLVSSLIFKYVNLRSSATLEFSLFMLLSYIPFVVCEAFGLSGVLAVFFSGMFMAHYTIYNVSPDSNITIEQTIQTLRFVAETFCFAYLGMSLPFIVSSINIVFVLAALTVLLVSRACAVFPLSTVCNLFVERKIELKHQIAIWFTGLRGAVAVALAMSFPGASRELVISTTLMLVLLTVTFLGGGTIPVLKVLKIEGTSAGQETLKVRHGGSIHNVSLQRESAEAAVPIVDPIQPTFIDKIELFDKNYLQVCLRRQTVDNDDYMDNA